MTTISSENVTKMNYNSTEEYLNKFTLFMSPGILGWRFKNSNNNNINIVCSQQERLIICNESKGPYSFRLEEIDIVFISTCVTNNENKYKIYAKQWLEDNGCSLHDNHYSNVDLNLFIITNTNFKLFEKYCKQSIYFDKKNYDLFIKNINPDTKPKLKPLYITEFRKIYKFLPDRLQKLHIIPLGKLNRRGDIEYSKRREYFIDNKLCLGQLLQGSRNNTSVVVKPEHRFKFEKNKGKYDEYKLLDFLYDLEHYDLYLSF